MTAEQAAAVAWLDETFGEYWPAGIDVEKLYMGAPWSCIVGQLTGVEEKMQKTVPDPYVEFDEAFGTDRPHWETLATDTPDWQRIVTDLVKKRKL
jgi:hypothetical protein